MLFCRNKGINWGVLPLTKDYAPKQIDLSIFSSKIQIFPCLTPHNKIIIWPFKSLPQHSSTSAVIIPQSALYLYEPFFYYSINPSPTSTYRKPTKLCNNPFKTIVKLLPIVQPLRCWFNYQYFPKRLEAEKSSSWPNPKNPTPQKLEDNPNHHNPRKSLPLDH